MWGLSQELIKRHQSLCTVKNLPNGKFAIFYRLLRFERRFYRRKRSILHNSRFLPFTHLLTYLYRKDCYARLALSYKSRPRQTLE